MVEDLTRVIVNHHQKYINCWSKGKFHRKMPVISYDVVKETIINTLDFLESEKIDRSEWTGMIAGNVADVTGLEYLDVYQVVLKNGSKKWN